MGAKSKSGAALMRSASFRNRSQMGSKTDLAVANSSVKSERGFKTPCSTPRRLPKMRRSVSSGDLSPTALANVSDVSPIRRLHHAGEVEDDEEEKEVSIRAGLVLEQAMAKLQLQEEKEALKQEAEKAKAKVTESD